MLTLRSTCQSGPAVAKPGNGICMYIVLYYQLITTQVSTFGHLGTKWDNDCL